MQSKVKKPVLYGLGLILASGALLAIAGGRQNSASTAYVKTIRPEAASLYRSYEEMVERADAIFVGRPESDLAGGKGTLTYFPNSQQIETFQTVRSIKVARVIKNNGNIDIKSGKSLNLSEQAILANQAGQVVRIIGPDYEEMLSHNKYLFFVYKTNDDRVILFNGRFSKMSLEKKEADEDAAKFEMKRKATQQFGNQF